MSIICHFVRPDEAPVSQTTDGHVLVVRYVPEWMPGAGFKAKAREWRGHTENVLNMPYDKAKKDYVGLSLSRLSENVILTHTVNSWMALLRYHLFRNA